MAFIKDYLEGVEIKKFHTLNIKYHRECSNNQKILGTEKCFGKVRCTIDREKNLYLFDCGNNYRDRLDTSRPTIYFALIIGINNPYVVYFSLDKHYGLLERNGYEVFWKMVEINNPEPEIYSNELVLNYIKDALKAYGIDDDPETESLVVAFDF